MSKKIGIVRFLGTNCDRDVWKAIEDEQLQPEWLWYQDQFDPKNYRAVILPGGFSYGDYLRSGALAARMPVMKSVLEGARRGVPLLGICNGFQILCETGLLPGTLLRNQHLRFVDEWVDLKLVNANAHWASAKMTGCRIPVAHGDGRFFIDEGGLKALQDKNMIWWRYVDNPNGSVDNIAGVMNSQGNVAGLMPHPERATHDWMGRPDGRVFFETLL